jgi:hypothetical protein
MGQAGDYIVVVNPAVASQSESDRGIREISQGLVRLATNVPTETLTSNFEKFINGILGVLNAVPEGQASYGIEEIELSCEISGEGKVQLIGGLTAGMKGGITFKLRRRPGISESHG